jgi:hypothetical protein
VKQSNGMPATEPHSGKLGKMNWMLPASSSHECPIFLACAVFDGFHGYDEPISCNDNAL